MPYTSAWMEKCDWNHVSKDAAQVHVPRSYIKCWQMPPPRSAWPPVTSLRAFVLPKAEIVAHPGSCNLQKEPLLQEARGVGGTCAKLPRGPGMALPKTSLFLRSCYIDIPRGAKKNVHVWLLSHHCCLSTSVLLFGQICHAKWQSFHPHEKNLC